MKLQNILSLSSALFCVCVLTIFVGCKDKKTAGSEEVIEEPEIDTAAIVQPDTAQVLAPDTVPTVTVDTAKAEAVAEEAVSEDTFTHDPDLLASLKNNDGAHLTGPKTIYLTFDDGPSALTPKILKVLRENGVHATFFVTAQNKACLHYIKDAFQDGNAIAVHSYTHNFRTIYTDQHGYFEDLEKMNDVIEEQTGQRSHIIRFPGGSSNTVFLHYNKDPQFMLKLMKEVLNRGYQYVDWNADSRDASTNFPTAELVASSACHASKADLCLLMHDLQSKEGTLKALPSIIKYFKEKGYEFGTLTSTAYVNHHDPERSYRQALNTLSSKKTNTADKKVKATDKKTNTNDKKAASKETKSKTTNDGSLQAAKGDSTKVAKASSKKSKKSASLLAKADAKSKKTGKQSKRETSKNVKKLEADKHITKDKTAKTKRKAVVPVPSTETTCQTSTAQAEAPVEQNSES